MIFNNLYNTVNNVYANRIEEETRMRYPIGVQTFEEIINGKYVYVDKTDLVYTLAHGHICFLSRPRRFGKSLLISTLDAYFSGKKELFKGLKIEELEMFKSECGCNITIDVGHGNTTRNNEELLDLKDITYCHLNDKNAYFFDKK